MIADEDRFDWEENMQRLRSQTSVTRDALVMAVIGVTGIGLFCLLWSLFDNWFGSVN